MTATAWAHLPNAKHIDTVLADVKARPDAWREVRRELREEAALKIARSVASSAAWHVEKISTRNVVRNASLSEAWGVALALIAWDSSADLLDQPPDVLRAMIDLADAPVRHQAALLLPYSIVRFGI